MQLRPVFILEIKIMKVTFTKKMVAGQVFKKEDGKATTEIKSRWNAGEIKFAQDLTTLSKEDLIRLAGNFARASMQWGLSTLYRSHGGIPANGTYGQFHVTDGVFSFNGEYVAGMGGAKRQAKLAAEAKAHVEKVAAQVEIVAGMLGRELTESEINKIADAM